MPDWETTFTQSAQSPGSTEQTRCDNAVGIIRNAIDRHAVLGPKLRSHSVRVFVQGSYRNRVNVRADSDVDVGVLYTDAFFGQYPEALFASWPKEHYENGRDKNDRTHRRYRGLVRILKNLRSELDDAGHPAAQSIPGYLLECLTWNAPDTCFDRYGWYARLGAVLGYLGTQIDSGSSWQTWREVDKVKLLFAQSQPWTPVQARAFINAAWAYLGAR